MQNDVSYGSAAITNELHLRFDHLKKELVLRLGKQRELWLVRGLGHELIILDCHCDGEVWADLIRPLVSAQNFGRDRDFFPFGSEGNALSMHCRAQHL